MCPSRLRTTLWQSRIQQKYLKRLDHPYSGEPYGTFFRCCSAGAYIPEPLFCLKLETREAIQVSPTRGEPMEWICPDFEEVSLGCEINCYATAEL